MGFEKTAGAAGTQRLDGRRAKSDSEDDRIARSAGPDIARAPLAAAPAAGLTLGDSRLRTFRPEGSCHAPAAA